MCIASARASHSALRAVQPLGKLAEFIPASKPAASLLAALVQLHDVFALLRAVASGSLLSRPHP